MLVLAAAVLVAVVALALSLLSFFLCLDLHFFSVAVNAGEAVTVT